MSPPIKQFQDAGPYRFTTQNSTENVTIPFLPLGIFTISTIEVYLTAYNIADVSDRLSRHAMLKVFGVPGGLILNTPYFYPMFSAGDGSSWTANFVDVGTGIDVKVDSGNGLEVHWDVEVEINTAPIL